MKKSFGIKMLLVVGVIAIGILVSKGVTAGSLKYIENEFGTAVAMEQMENTEGTDEMLDTYRNLRNDINTWVPIITGVIVIAICGVIVTPQRHNKDEESDSL